jgi:hypothetical protein
MFGDVSPELLTAVFSLPPNIERSVSLKVFGLSQYLGCTTLFGDLSFSELMSHRSASFTIVQSTSQVPVPKLETNSVAAQLTQPFFWSISHRTCLEPASNLPPLPDSTTLVAQLTRIAQSKHRNLWVYNIASDGSSLRFPFIRLPRERLSVHLQSDVKLEKALKSSTISEKQGVHRFRGGHACFAQS